MRGLDEHNDRQRHSPAPHSLLQGWNPNIYPAHDLQRVLQLLLRHALPRPRQLEVELFQGLYQQAHGQEDIPPVRDLLLRLQIDHLLPLFQHHHEAVERDPLRALKCDILDGVRNSCLPHTHYVIPEKGGDGSVCDGFGNAQHIVLLCIPRGEVRKDRVEELNLPCCHIVEASP